MAASQIPLTSQLVRQGGANFPLADSNDLLGSPHVYGDVVLLNAAFTNTPSLFKVGQLVTLKIPTLATYQIVNLSPFGLVSFGGGGGGGLPPFSGTDGAVLVENGNPTPFASFSQLTFSNIDATGTLSIGTAVGTTSVVMGQALGATDITFGDGGRITKETTNLLRITQTGSTALGSDVRVRRIKFFNTLNDIFTFTQSISCPDGSELRLSAGNVKIDSATVSWDQNASIYTGGFDLKLGPVGNNLQISASVNNIAPAFDFVAVGNGGSVGFNYASKLVFTLGYTTSGVDAVASYVSSVNNTSDSVTGTSTALIVDATGGTNTSFTRFAAKFTGAVLFNSSIGFFGTVPVLEQTSGANLTNNVTVGGTSDQIDDFTDLVVYANDATAIRNAIYQLARKLKQVNDGLRAYGLLT